MLVDGGEATSVRGSLLHLMDRTSTPFGARLLRGWLAEPLADADAINGRLDAVEELVAVRAGVRLCFVSLAMCSELVVL